MANRQSAGAQVTEHEHPGELSLGTGDRRPASQDFLVVAQVLGPHGVRGELKCRVVTDFPERFKRGARVFAGNPPAPYVIQRARVSGGVAYLALRDVGDREAADGLRGLDLLVPTADAVPLPEGQFYWRDVIGLRVETVDGARLGEVVDIIETGANDVYVVRGESGEVLVPAIKDVVKEISPGAGRMLVEPLPGMLPERPSGRRRSFGPRRRRQGRVPGSPPRTP